MTNAPNWWTDERVAELKDRWANNETYAEICHAMRAKSRNAVIGKAHRLQLFRPAQTSTAVRVRKRAKTVRRRRVFNGHFIVSEERMIEDKPPIFANPKPFIELGAGDCRWPGEGRPGPDLPCCGAPAIEGRPYCATHCRIAYAGAPKPKS